MAQLVPLSLCLILVALSGTRAGVLKQRQITGGSCGNLEDDWTQCDALVNTYNMACTEILTTFEDGSTETLGDVCQKTCCLANAKVAKKRVEQLLFSMELEAQEKRHERQEEDEAMVGGDSCDDLYNMGVGDSCNELVLTHQMDCEATVFTNPDNSTSTLEEICQKTCCKATEAGANSDDATEKKAKQLLFDKFEGALKQRQEDTDGGPCSGLYNKAVGDQCDNLVNSNHLDCVTTIFVNPDNSTSTLGEICEKTCCQAKEAEADSDTSERRAKYFFNFEARDVEDVAMKKADEEPAKECKDMYDDCDVIVAMEGVDCDTTFTDYADNSKITVGIDWCKKTCGNCH